MMMQLSIQACSIQKFFFPKKNVLPMAEVRDNAKFMGCTLYLLKNVSLCGLMTAFARFPILTVHEFNEEFNFEKFLI